MDMIKDSPFEKALIEIISEGLPLVEHPYATIAAQLGCSETMVIDGIERIMARGDIKRFGVVVRHRKLGYQRPRRLPEWRYNLFSMIHGQDRAAVIEQVEFIVEKCGLHEIEHEILFSQRCFKQRGASYSHKLQPDHAGMAVNG